TFSRQSEQDLKPIQLRLIVKEALKLLRASLPSTIEIQSDIHSDFSVLADATQIHQVLMNLCTNAAHAMRTRGGVLDVKLQATQLDAEYTVNFPDLEPGPFVKLTVSDTGHGMSREVIDRIFDPFYTTKKKGEGTGMGLSVVHGIAKSHGGSITVYSEPGKGSTFNVFLPAIERRMAPKRRREAAVPGGTERILFVDDEEMLTDMTKQILERLGYHVVAENSS
ncbi:MAG: hybrid sensor histidine kinase/response regulator, partial [Desulfobacterales bacterium]|nr:hybrid sensor histidine kinase/response regulator [Desulfobacterales bacterium]